MAQALCGPSNALQNLQKHTSTDRSLQQDRLVSSQSSSSTQNFRSRIPDEDLAADAELAAFESGIAVPAPPPPALAGPAAFAAHHHAFQQQHPHHPAPFAPPSAIAAHQAESSWAADFQQLSISGAPTQHARSQALPFRPAVGGWHEEFMQQQRLNPLHQQQQQSAPVPVPTQQQQHHVSQRLFGTVGAMNPMSQFNMYNSPATTTAFNNQGTTTQQQPTETFDDAAFEAAFAEARAEIDQLEQQSSHHVHENVTTTTTTETIDAAESLHHQEVRIGADTIQNTTDRSGVDQQDDLARTAGQLLDSVQHETSQKFKESNFLALMRQLRDREVVVDGDEFRQVKQPLHPGGEFYPEGRRSIAEAVVEEVVAQQQSQQQQQQQQQSSDSELPPLPYGHGYETSYGNNYIESKSLGDSNVLYDGMAWEKGVLPDYLRVV